MTGQRMFLWPIKAKNVNKWPYGSFAKMSNNAVVDLSAFLVRLWGEKNKTKKHSGSKVHFLPS